MQRQQTPPEATKSKQFTLPKPRTLRFIGCAIGILGLVLFVIGFVALLQASDSNSKTEKTRAEIQKTRQMARNSVADETFEVARFETVFNKLLASGVAFRDARRQTNAAFDSAVDSLTTGDKKSAQDRIDTDATMALAHEDAAAQQFRADLAQAEKLAQ